MFSIRRLFAAVLGSAIVVLPFPILGVAQQYPEVSESLQSLAFEHYASHLDYTFKLHNLGFQTRYIMDYDNDDRDEPEPFSSRFYGLIAELENGKFRRGEWASWFIRDAGIEWREGERAIINDQGSFFQNDPGALFRNEGSVRRSCNRSQPGARVKNWSGHETMFSALIRTWPNHRL